MLQVTELRSGYGAIEALKGISLEVQEGELVSILGANGAGKTTLLKTIAGLLAPRRGRVLFMGREISGRPPDQILREGIALVPERRRIFGPLRVLDNLLLGAYARRGDGDVSQRLETVYGLFPVLRERRAQLGGTLSGGEQQMLAIGRALMSRPRLLLLDEPSLGLAPILAREIFAVVRRLREEGVTILLVEQMAAQALELADRAYVLERGRITLDGPARAVGENPAVVQAYLGRRDTRAPS
jgi:branched-chain amino acid transport system ATP-binding protein